MKRILIMMLLVSAFSNLNAQETRCALWFDGVDDIAVVPSDTLFDLTNGFTIEAWSYPFSSRFDMNLVSRQTEAGQYAPWSFTIRDQSLRLWIGSGEVISSPVLQPIMQHVAVTWQAGSGKVMFYCNGSIVDSALAAVSFAALPYDIIIGGVPGYPDGTFFGLIDEIRIWNEVRTPQDILRCCLQELGESDRSDPHLIAYWQMSECTNQSLIDHSIYERNGHLGFSEGIDASDPKWSSSLFPTSYDGSELPPIVAAIHAWPNPFSEILNIELEAYSADMFTVDIFSVDGRRVAQIWNGVLEPGRYSYRWNMADNSPNNIGSGVYFCRAHSKGKSVVAKVILCR